MRPCVVVSDPSVASEQRYPLICVVPITGTPGEGVLYPELHPGSSGLAKISYALIDQVRSVDKTRLLRLYGTLSVTEMESLDNGLIWFLGLARRLR
jgi:mRNA interferase MazF